MMEMVKTIKKLVETSLLARFNFPSPMAIEHNGAPPTPTNAAKAPINVTNGPHTPMAAKANDPPSAMWPI